MIFIASLLHRRVDQFLELIIMFIGLPLLLYLDVLPVPKFSLLFLVTLIYLFVLLKDSSFDRSLLLMHPFSLWKPMLLVFCFFAFLSAVLVWVVWPSMFFSMPVNETTLWVSIMVFYPLFSVLPQTFVFRVYFFHRFKGFFGSERWAIVVNALLFSFMHLVFKNWLAIILTFFGGLLFAATYLRSRSMVISAVEHALFGCWVFTVGIGSFFFIPWTG